MLPSEVYQYQLAVKIYMNNPVGRFVGSSYKSNSYQIHKLFRQAVHQTKGLHSKDFNQGWSMVTRSFDFSSNGDFLVSVPLGVVVLWRTAQFLGISTNLKPTLTMDFKHHTEMISNITTR